MLSRYRGRYRDIIFVPSGVPSRDQHNDPDDDDDDDDDLNGDRDDKHRLSDQIGQVQSKIDRAALHTGRDLIVGMELQKKDPRVSGYQKGQVLYKQPAVAPEERRFRIFRKQILQISGPISGKMTRYRVLMTGYRKPQYQDTP